MADLNERLEKQMEGTNLALAAVAEVLQKMDGRLAKEEADKEEEEIEKAEALAKAELVKSIAAEVQAVLKASEGDSYAGSDASGDERKADPTGGTPQSADDSESDAGIDAKIEEQQNTIQAMKKADDDDDDEMEKGAHDDEDKEEKGMYKDDDDEAADEPVEEKGMDDDDDSDDMKAMKKQLETLKKQLAETEANIQKSVQAESEARLRKMGFREETGLQAPKVVNSFGIDDTTPIQKSTATADTAGQLAELSYSELRRMQHQIEQGNTDGVPKELLG
mgnify:CR=1 FL=1|tara:strand:+ start:1680 stop:2513 length:834 start_codon:yes stop_codon:yes gene_type:complete